MPLQQSCCNVFSVMMGAAVMGMVAGGDRFIPTDALCSCITDDCASFRQAVDGRLLIRTSATNDDGFTDRLVVIRWRDHRIGGGERGVWADHFSIGCHDKSIDFLPRLPSVVDAGCTLEEILGWLLGCNNLHFIAHVHLLKFQWIKLTLTRL